MLEHFQIGWIVKAHGLKGEAKVLITSEAPGRFRRPGNVFLRTKDGLVSREVERTNPQGNTAIVKFAGIDSVEALRPYIGSEVLIAREDAMPLGENEYYIGDLIGSGVFTEDGKKLGILADIFRTGANDVYEVKRADGEGENVLIPAIRDCILSVDPEKQKIVVHLLDGLLQEQE